MKSIGFIGAGNMGYALAKAVAHRFPEIEIHVFDTKPERIELFCKELRQARPCGDAAEAARAAEAVFLAVKPQDYSTVLPQIRGTEAMVISIAAGVTIARLEEALPRARVVRVMPNIPCLVGVMAAGYAFGSRATAEDRDTVRILLSVAGRAVPVEEPLLDVVTGVSGSGPAFVVRLMEAFMVAGRRLGLPADASRELTLQTFLGTARMLQETGMEPEALVAMVSPPGGTTVAGRAVLEASDLGEVIFRSVEAAANRSRELAQS